MKNEARVIKVPRTEEVTEPRIDQLLKLLDVCRFMGLEKNLDQLLYYIAEQGGLALHADRCSIFLLDESRNEIWSKVQMGESCIIRFPRGTGIAGETIESGKLQRIDDPYRDPNFNSDIDRMTGYLTENILCVPMTNIVGKTIGCLQFLNKRDAAFSQADENFSLAFAAQAAVAIESACLYQERGEIIHNLSQTQARLQQKLEQIEVIRELERSVSESGSVEEFVQTLVQQTVRAVGAEFACLILRTDDGGWKVFGAAAHSEIQVWVVKLERLSSPTLERLMADGKTLLFNTMTTLDEHEQWVAQSLNASLKNMLALKLVPATNSQTNEHQGIFQVFNKLGDFHAEDQTFIQIIGAQIFSLITRKRLIEDKERAKSLAAIGQVASSIVHDLKNPISAIIGCAELLSSRDQMSEQQVERMCTIIRTQAKRSISMVEELLDVARGDRHFHFETLPLQTVLDEIIFLLQVETERRKITLTTDFQFDGQVKVDQAKLMRVIFNLTNNALEMLKTGGALFLASKAQDVHWVEIIVSDNGPGIPVDIQGSLFQAFTTYGKSKATGLGLYIAREILQDHGGKIDLDRSYQDGARFRILLPREG